MESAAQLQQCCPEIRMHILRFPPPRWEPPRNYRDLFVRSLTSSRPYAVANFPGQPLADQVAELAAEADLIWVERLYVAEWIQSGRDRMIVDLDDLEHVKEARRLALKPLKPYNLLLRLDNLKVRLLELTAPRRYARVVVCSESDRERFSKIAQHRVLVVPNGIASRLVTQPKVDNGSLPSIVFVGDMCYEPNFEGAHWFAKEIFPKIQTAVPGVRLYLVGQDSRRKVQPLHNGDSIIVTGWVEDVTPYVSGAAVSVVPIRWAGGTRIKILESLALGTPGVATTIGAEGLGLGPDQQIAVADSPERFARAVTTILRNPEVGAAMATTGREIVRERFTWESVGQQLVAALEDQLIERHFHSFRHAFSTAGRG
jgi:glycosyltransferase involved in cell wall biosynthesis